MKNGHQITMLGTGFIGSFYTEIHSWHPGTRSHTDSLWPSPGIGERICQEVGYPPSDR